MSGSSKEFMGPRLYKAIGSKICVLARHDYLSSVLQPIIIIVEGSFKTNCN